jgi:hypothetical protein
MSKERWLWVAMGVLRLGGLLGGDVVWAQGTVSFIARRDFATGRGPASVAVGDFNGDGHLDLAVANRDDDSVSILLGQGDGTFQAAPAAAVSPGPGSMAVGDFNGDGRPDLAVASGGNNVLILLGQGNGTFVGALLVGVGNNPTFVTVGDFNGDGRPDLAVTNFYADTVSILINNTSTLASCLGTGPSTLHGKVKTTTDKSPLVGVTLTLGGPESCQDTSTTDIKRKYAFPGLANGTYTVTPSQEGCAFTPATRTVTIAGTDVKAGFKGTYQVVPSRGMIASP